MAEYELTGYASFGKEIALRVTSLQVAKAHASDGAIESPIELKVSEVEVDRAMTADGKITKPPLDLYCSPAKDSAFSGDANIARVIEVAATPGKSVSIEPSGNIQIVPELRVSPAIDMGIQGEAKLNAPILRVSPAVDRRITPEPVQDPGIGLKVNQLGRSILTIAPTGHLCVAAGAISEESCPALDKAVLPRGTTIIIQAETFGTRLDCYEILFEISREPQGVPAIRKTNTPTPGGVSTLSSTNLSANSETDLKLVAQIVLYPPDTMQFDTKTVLFWQCRMGQKGLGEDYLIEKGTLTIVTD